MGENLQMIYLINEISRIYKDQLKLNNKANVPIKNETKF